MQLQQFIHEFIHLWGSQLNIQWDPGAIFYSMSEEGPHLSLLPEDYLLSLERNLLHLKSQLEKV